MENRPTSEYDIRDARRVVRFLAKLIHVTAHQDRMRPEQIMSELDSVMPTMVESLSRPIPLFGDLSSGEKAALQAVISQNHPSTPGDALPHILSIAASLRGLVATG